MGSFDHYFQTQCVLFQQEHAAVGELRETRGPEQDAVPVVVQRHVGSEVPLKWHEDELWEILL